jgi:4-hydroxybenzoyl-CoA reductase subunit beta
LSLPEFQLLRPTRVKEAVTLLERHNKNLQILAGGTDLIPSMRQRLFAPQYVMDITGIGELRGIRESTDGLAIGALTPLSSIEHDPVIRRDYPVLAEAAATVASPVLRNMGTIGGNICLDTRCLWYNQSLTWRKSCGFCIKKDGDICHVAPGGTECWAAFSADTPAALLCLDAEVEIVNGAWARRVALRDFYTNVGDAHLNLAKDELLTRVLLPRRMAGRKGAYRKLRVRGSIDYPLAGVAISAANGGGALRDVRVAITAVNPAPLLVEDEDLAAGNENGSTDSEDKAEYLGELAAKTSRPLTTSALTPEYRREMIRVLAKRAFESLSSGVTRDPRKLN